MLFIAPAEKINSIKTKIRNLTSSRVVTPKDIARIAGHMIALGPAFGNISQLFTRQMYAFIESSDFWYQRKILPDGVREELKFWLNNLDDKNGHSILRNPIITKIIYSDASKVGYGGYIVQRMGCTIAQRKFSPNETNTSSTYRELAAVLYMLQSFKSILRNETIQWNSDNQNVGRIIQVGSTKPVLQLLALQIYHLCLQNNNKIHSVSRPREENTLADHFSRPNDTDDFGIDFKSFYYIQRKLGARTVDRFADDKNTKLNRFNSKYYCPNSEAADAFSVNWQGEFNWLLSARVIIQQQLIPYLRWIQEFSVAN